MEESTSPAVQSPTFLRDRAYVAAAGSHFFVDILNSSRTVLVALLASSLGLSNAQVGIALLLYNVGSALSQPFLGLLTDRRGPRYFVAGGLAWMVAMYGLAAILGGWGALAAITLAGFGSGAVHPAGTKVASESSSQARTQATGFFFASGQIGLFLGPILAGFLLQELGQPGYLILPALAFSAVLAGWRWLNDRPSGHSEWHERIVEPLESWQREWRTLIPLMAVILTGPPTYPCPYIACHRLSIWVGSRPTSRGWRRRTSAMTLSGWFSR